MWPYWWIWFVAFTVIRGIYLRITALPIVRLSDRETLISPFQCNVNLNGGGVQKKARVDQAGKPLRERIQVFPFHAGVIPCREAQLMGTIVTRSQRGEEKAAQRERRAKHNHQRQLSWRAAFPPSSHHWQLTALRPRRWACSSARAVPSHFKTK